MHNWNNNRILRVLICLILICSLLINVSPIRAKAIVTEAQLAYVAAEVAVACIFQALGFMAGQNNEAFTDAVNRCVQHLKETTTFVTQGLIAVLGVGLAAQGDLLTYLPRSLIQEVWEWLFIFEVVSTIPIIGSGATILANTQIPFYYGMYIIPTYDCLLVRYYEVSDTGRGFMYNFFTVLLSPLSKQTATVYNPDGSVYQSNNAVSKVTYNDELLQYLQFSFSQYWAYSDFTLQKLNDLLSLYPGYLPLENASSSSGQNLLRILESGLSANLQYAAAEGLLLGLIQSPIVGEDIVDISTAEAYQNYLNSMEVYEYQNDGGTGSSGGDPYVPGPVPYWPIGIPSYSFDEVLGQTQEEAQSGNTGIDLEESPMPDPTPDPEPEPDPNPNPDPDPNPNPDPDPGTDPDSGSSSWVPSGPMGNFALDLKNYFPFCIPFDLYAFFTCLNADPVAPVIDWIIPMPGGGSYPFQIDLSVFNPVAQTLRRLQLLLFCVGLAFKTRDLIKG